MVAAATLGNAGGTAATTESSDSKKAPIAVVPFIRASGRHRELVYDTSITQLTSDIDLAPIDVNAYGFMRSLVIQVTSTLGAGTTVTATEDAPFNALKNIQLLEPNGAILSQWSSGYHMYQANKCGGYVRRDPKQLPSYLLTVGSSALIGFKLRVPVELNARDGLGSLPNQNAAATFKLRLTLAKIADVFGGTVSTAPSIRIRVWLEAWDQPEVATAGQTNQTVPPAMNTTQFWTEQQFNVSAGQQTIRMTRMGNYLRNIIFILRRAGTSRANGDTDFPDPATLALDTRNIDLIGKGIWQDQVAERYSYFGTADAAGARDNGVYPYDFCSEFDGQVGFENRDLWLPTLSSTRFELQGSFTTAGVLTVITNDVSVAGNVFI